MRRSSLLLLASLGANLALVAALALRPSAGPDEPADSSAAISVESRVAPALTAVPAPPPTPGRSWRAIGSMDYRTLLARLNEAGFPTVLARAIVREMISADFSRRRAELATRTEAAYWQPPVDTNGEEKTSHRLSVEERRIVRETLGDTDDLTDEIHAAYAIQRFGNLSATSLARLSDGFDFEPLPPEADRAAHLALAKAQREAIVAVLTPAELEQYDLRNGRAAMLLQATLPLGALNLTEAEYVALYRSAASNPTLAQLLQANESPNRQQLLAALLPQLTPERQADLEFATAPANRTTIELTNRLELPLSAARTVVSVQSDITARADAIRANPALSATERTAQLQSLATEAQSRLTMSLGTRGYEAYKRRAGSWLGQLAPPP